MPGSAGSHSRDAALGRSPAAGAEAKRANAGRSGSRDPGQPRYPKAKWRREALAMTWATFYLVCFVIGLALSVLSFLMGGVRWHLHFHFHLPHGGPVHGVPQGASGHLASGVKGGAARGGQISPFNF